MRFVITVLFVEDKYLEINQEKVNKIKLNNDCNISNIITPACIFM